MIVLPLFWDQFDNAQRMAELGFGVRLPTYDFEDDELRDAVARLLVDGDLRRRMSVEGERIRARDGKTVAADLIEEMAVRDRAHG
jgi:UDP:flavonoid glycosyltransferase YjiC (YdhE family)